MSHYLTDILTVSWMVYFSKVSSGISLELLTKEGADAKGGKLPAELLCINGLSFTKPELPAAEANESPNFPWIADNEELCDLDKISLLLFLVLECELFF